MMETPKNLSSWSRLLAWKAFSRFTLIGILFGMLFTLTGCTSWPWQEKPKEQRPRTVTEWMSQSERPDI